MELLLSVQDLALVQQLRSLQLYRPQFLDQRFDQYVGVWLVRRALAAFVANQRLAGARTPPAKRVAAQQRDRFTQHQVADAAIEPALLLLLLLQLIFMMVRLLLVPLLLPLRRRRRRLLLLLLLMLRRRLRRGQRSRGQRLWRIVFGHLQPDHLEERGGHVPQKVGGQRTHPEAPGIQVQRFAHPTALGQRIGVLNVRVQTLVTDDDVVADAAAAAATANATANAATADAGNLLRLAVVLLLLLLLLLSTAIRADVQTGELVVRRDFGHKIIYTNFHGVNDE